MTEENTTTERYRRLANGAVYDNTTKRIVKGATLTSDTASALVAKRIEKKRAIARLAANEAIERGDFHATYGQDAYFAAIINTATIKATTPEDPKAIESGRFVLTMTGDLEAIGQSPDTPLSDLRGLVRELADLARTISQAAPSDDYIDASEVGQLTDFDKGHISDE